jgi:hypothetical protein
MQASESPWLIALQHVWTCFDDHHQLPLTVRYICVTGGHTMEQQVRLPACQLLLIWQCTTELHVLFVQELMAAR